MKKLIIKIDGNMDKDIKKAFKEPREEELNTHTLYLTSEQFKKMLKPEALKKLKAMGDIE